MTRNDPMDHDELTRWTTALRSGQYIQTKFSLRSDEGYCCLGVYCDLASYPRWIRRLGVWHFGAQLFRLSGYLMDKIGLDEVAVNDLISMNDDLSYTFDRIASELEHYHLHGSWSAETLCKLRIYETLIEEDLVTE